MRPANGIGSAAAGAAAGERGGGEAPSQPAPAVPSDPPPPPPPPPPAPPAEPPPSASPAAVLPAALAEAETLAVRVVRGYGQVLFCAHPAVGLLFLAGTFVRPDAGLLGLLGAVSCTLAARLLRVYPIWLDAGIFATNGLLIGLALGAARPLTPTLALFMVGAGAIAAVVVAGLIAVLGVRWNLPVLSIAFVAVAWVGEAALAGLARDVPELALAAVSGTAGAVSDLGRIERAVRELVPALLQGYFRCLSACFYSSSVTLGLVLCAGLLAYSRIAVLGTLLGAATAFGLLGAVGIPAAHVVPGSAGFNAVLAGLALAAFFLVPGVGATLYAVLGAAAAALVGLAADAFLGPLGLAPLAAPFNLVALLFLLPLRAGFLPGREADLISVPAECLRRAEDHLAWWRGVLAAERSQKTFLRLPILGVWRVSQGVDGPTTHRGAFRHAWDFVVVDDEAHTHTGMGVRCEDYFAYGAPVAAPAAGRVVRVIDDVADNTPPEINRDQNWGNCLILDHGNGEYSELSHFKPQTIKVKEGEWVVAGQVLGQCGNSGRSPEPHLHYQLQTRADPGAPTRAAIIAAYLRTTPEGPALELGGVPRAGDLVQPYDETEAAGGAPWWPFVEGVRRRWAVERAVGEGAAASGTAAAVGGAGDPPEAGETWGAERWLDGELRIVAEREEQVGRALVRPAGGFLRFPYPTGWVAARPGASAGAEGSGAGSVLAAFLLGLDPLPLWYHPQLSWTTCADGAAYGSLWARLLGRPAPLACAHRYAPEEPRRTRLGPFTTRRLDTVFRDAATGEERGRRRIWFARDTGPVRIEFAFGAAVLVAELAAVGAPAAAATPVAAAQKIADPR